MRRERVLDVTSGPIFGKLLLFALPLIATGLLQCTFNAADIVVAGKFAEEGALAAVGATSSFVSLLVNFFMGLSVGVTIAVSHALGGKQMQEAGDHVHNAIATALCCGLIILVLGELFARPVLTLLKTPEGPVMEGALQYLRIYFLGSPAFLVYNFGAALLRTSGDTRRPMYFLTLAGVANAGMNLFFVLGLGWRTVQMAAAGVALATILSHYVSAICVLVCLFHSRNFLRLEVRRIRIHPRLFRRILVLGVPAGIQSSLFSISNIMLQSNINSFGAIAMAGNTAAVSLESFAGTAMDAFQQSSVTFIGQNKGAGRYDRFVGVWRTNLLTAMVSSLLLGMALYALSPALLQLYIASDASPDTLSFALSRCAVDFPLYLAAGMMVVGGGTLRGLGRSTTAMLSSVFGICGLRFFWMGLIYPRLIPLAQGNPFEQIKALYLVYPFTWFVTALLQMGLFFLFLHLQKKKHPELFLRPQERICRETEKETV